MPVRSRLAALTAASGAVVLAGSVAAVAAGTPTPDAPPRIAFVADAFVPADALAVGPIAGQLGAPVFTTAASGLSEAAATGLDAYDPELVIVAGGPGALPDTILDEIRTATGLSGADVDRVFGVGRTETAAALASLFEDRGIDPAFLPVGATATDAELLDGLDSTAFVQAGDPVDADTLGGQGADAFAAAPEPTSRSAVCGRADFFPDYDPAGATGDARGYSETASMVDGVPRTYRRPDNAALICTIEVPVGATLTGVTATVVDDSAVEDVNRCRLHELPVRGPAAGDRQELADLGGTSGQLDAVQELTAALSGTIDVPTSLELECSFGDHVKVGIFGATVDYTVPAVPTS